MVYIPDEEACGIISMMGGLEAGSPWGPLLSFGVEHLQVERWHMYYGRSFGIGYLLYYLSFKANHVIPS